MNHLHSYLWFALLYGPAILSSIFLLWGLWHFIQQRRKKAHRAPSL